MAGADLSGASLYWCVLIEVNLEGANLEGANLRGADLSAPVIWVVQRVLGGSDFTGANLDGVVLTGALYDHDVKFPDPRIGQALKAAERPMSYS